MTVTFAYPLRAGFIRTALSLLVALVILCVPGFAQTKAEPKFSFDVPAGEAKPMLRQFATQAKREIVFPVQAVEGIKTNPVKGEMTAQEAVDQMLANTGLVASRDGKTGAFAIRKETPIESKNVASRPARDRAADSGVAAEVIKLDTFEVFGRKTLNMDIRRTRDDIQPYVTFSREEITQTGATNVEDFLKQRLTMNTVSGTRAQDTGSGILGIGSAVNLRGLGANRTLILIDGRRSNGPSFNNSAGQTNVNGIPLASIERIEVLPATSAGIYGGSATAGVLNVILRRGYTGTELSYVYDNTFSSDAARNRFDLTSGISLLGGKASLLVSASWSYANALLLQDRDFLQRTRQLLLRNNPTLLLSPTSPPLGATANIGSSTGANLVLDNGTPLNANITFAPVGYAGGASDGGAALVGNAGRYNLNPSATASASFVGGGGGLMDLLRPDETKSLMATWRQDFRPNISGYLSVRLSDQFTESGQSSIQSLYTLPANAPTNPFQQAIVVRTPNPTLASARQQSTTKEREISAGLIAKTGGDTMLGLDVTWNRNVLDYRAERNVLLASGTTAATSGQLDVLRDAWAFPTDFSSHIVPASRYALSPFVPELIGTSFRFSRPVGSFTAGSPVVAGMVEFRHESMPESRQSFTPALLVYPSRSQDISSAYLESRIPVFSPAQRIPGAHRLEFQVALRHDDFRVKASTGTIDLTVAPNAVIERRLVALKSTNYTLGFGYSPMPGVSLRGSYGTGFQPPAMSQLVQSATFTSGATLRDPRRGLELLPANSSILTGGNPGLGPETSESFALGLILEPASTLRFSLDYVRTDLKDQIGTVPGASQGVLNFESSLPAGRVVRNPVQPGDPYGVGTVSVVDFTFLNLATTVVEAFDLTADWTFRPPALGEFTLSGAASWQPKFDVQLISGATFRNFVGIGFSQPLKYRANASLSWRRGPLALRWATTYYHSYYVADPTVPAEASRILSQGNGGIVPEQWYHDLSATWKFGTAVTPDSRWRKLLHGSEVQVGVRNLFNTSPPFDSFAAIGNFAGYSPYGDPRLASYWVSLRKSF